SQAWHPGAAADAAARGRRTGHRRRAAGGAGQDARWGLRRLLREDQARRVPHLALRRERLGDRALPDALLEGRNEEGPWPRYRKRYRRRAWPRAPTGGALS